MRKNFSISSFTHDSLKLAATLAIAAFTYSALPAFSQGLPPEPAAEQSLPATLSPSNSAPPAGNTTPQAGASTPQAAPPLATEPVLTAADGPMLAERRKLAETIGAAKNFGFGTTAYVNAFNGLEERVKAGAPELEVKNRLNSIVSGLDEQLKRAKQLKTQRPAPPIAASGPNPSSLESQVRSQFGGMGGGSSDQLMEKIKDKWFGGEIPDSIKKKIPAGFDPSMLNSDTAKELMKKYGH